MIGERVGRNVTLKSVPEGMDANAAEIWRTTQNLFELGAVAELRVFGGRGTVSGYFDNFETLSKRASRLDDQGYGVYVTLNPVLPALLSRYSNRTEQYAKATTKDSEISKRRWLPVDLDPVRPSGISASESEKSAAFERAAEIKGHLTGLEWPEPIEADSGNGAHLLYRVDLPNDAVSAALVRDVLTALDFRFSDNVVSVDKGVFNAARIWKLYGVMSRKGDDSKERPHRRSRIMAVGSMREASLREVKPCR
jgi:hypothetical protein